MVPIRRGSERAAAIASSEVLNLGELLYRKSVLTGLRGGTPIGAGAEGVPVPLTRCRLAGLGCPVVVVAEVADFSVSNLF